MNIFVTVGTGKFDELVQAIDAIAPKIKTNITMQIGKGEYLPKNAKFFRFSPSLDKYYKKADLIISHGGAGTIYELLGKGRKVIAVANLDRTDTHQYEILKALSEQGHLIWCRNLEGLESSIKSIKKSKLKRYNAPKCTIAEKINQFVSSR
jgi:UDP-N-acetylglucosamine transferase subunit ALG13